MVESSPTNLASQVGRYEEDTTRDYYWKLACQTTGATFKHFAQFPRRVVCGIRRTYQRKKVTPVEIWPGY